MVALMKESRANMRKMKNSIDEMGQDMSNMNLENKNCK